MNVVLANSHLAKHDFKYWIKGVGWGEQQRYSTEISEGHFNYSMRDTIFNVVPDDGRFPDSVGIINPLTYKWFANKVIYGDPLDYAYLNDSSTKIYLTYDVPLETEPRVIALDKICAYAQNENRPDSIAHKGVDGVYGEGWAYEPGDTLSADPLHVLRMHRGQCADYANLMTCLYRSIGLPANSVVIYNAADFGGVNNWLFWRYSTTHHWCCILSKSLTSCDDSTAEWEFTYHATSFAANLLCDASLGVVAPKSKYAEWWRYYLYPRCDTLPCDDTEPPPAEPTYHDWINYVPRTIVPNGTVRYWSTCTHP